MGYDYFLIIIISSSSTFSRLLRILIIMCMIIKTASGDTDLKFNCSSTSGNYTGGGTYESNLINLLADLNNTTPNHGFRNTSYGRDPDRVYGLALCRGDIPVENKLEQMKEGGGVDEPLHPPC
ncbi:hypothetical protein CASFOL_040924 [Castilleja foliolosa]|uniref:Gnk2-homologous domain-containing protein n=1 Tax=Castilleja foliolosa TaxID=1961234 RepID=A0ABD3BCZ5_9LAMI